MNSNRKSRTVHAQAGDLEATSTHRCCAERNVLEKWVRLASKNGIHPHSIIPWVRRKMGGYLVVRRSLCDDSPGCSVPCILCLREIQKYDLVVRCTFDAEDGRPCIFEGKFVPENTPPPSVLTRGQKRMFRVDCEPEYT